MTKWNAEGTRVTERVRDARRRQQREEQERQEKARLEQERRARLSPRELAIEQLDDIVVGQKISANLAKALAKALNHIDSTNNYEVEAVLDIDTLQHLVTVERRGFFSHSVTGNMYLVVNEEAIAQHTRSESLFLSWMKMVAQRVQSMITYLGPPWTDEKKRAYNTALGELEAVGVYIADRPLGRIITEDDVARTEAELRRFVRERQAPSPSPDTGRPE